jgi:hypothetical protein
MRRHASGTATAFNPGAGLGLMWWAMHSGP